VLFAAVSGLLFWLAYAGVGIWPLALVFAVPLLWALERPALSVRGAAALGVLAGTLTQLLGYAWLVGTLQRFSGMPTWACLPIFALFALYQGAAWGVACALSVRAAQRGWPLAWAFVAAWTAVELCYPALFEAPLGASLYATPLLLQGVDLGGPGLLSALLAACSAAAYTLLRRGRGAWHGPALVLGLLGALLGYGALRTAQLQDAISHAPTRQVALVQVNLGLQEKRRDQALALRRHLAASRAAEHEQPDLIVWPETAVPSFVPLDQRELSALVATLHTPVLLGALGHRVRRGRAELYNSAFLVDRGGRVLGRTDKQRLLPFGERMPLGDELPWLYDLAPGAGQFARGSGARALALGELRVAALICYEDILPSFVREVVRTTHPNLLVNMTNDAWFGDTAAPHIHLALSVLRAVEQRRFLVRATNSGVSAVIDPLGHVLQESGTFRAETLHARVALLSDDTLYTRLGDWPGLLATLLIALGCALRATSRS
jgi:apolipoprotein N-acyltransferase